MRGKAAAHILPVPSARITPACAGKRAFQKKNLCIPWDHPRVCGEKEWKDISTKSIIGSPPRVRGKVRLRSLQLLLRGITPACAGKRLLLVVLLRPFWDHPRVCGEKARCTAGIFPVSGSPSRVRGKENVDTYKRRHSRITPACAGKRQLALVTNVPNRDHPRVCGEKTGLSSRISPCGGSPPRVRGKVATLTFFRLFSGITPACAGKSKFKNIFFHGCKDHPRVCGEMLGAGSICFL